jgi:ParD-like antitoxin of type II bacterial toxin-antitoxin system
LKQEDELVRTSPTRVDEDLFASAQMVGAIMDRSAAQQITHWARIGRELEATAQVSHRAIAEVLAGQARYDNLNAHEQAVVRAEWQDRLEARRAQLDLAKRFAQEGRTYVELDQHGKVVTRKPVKKGHKGA